jgi:hypothetical protein
MLLSNIVEHLKLPRSHARRPDIPHLPTFYSIVQRLHNLLRRHIPIEPMDLQHIDICPQPLHTRIHRIKDMLPTQPHTIHHHPIIHHRLAQIHTPSLLHDLAFVHAEEDFGKQHEFLAGDAVFRDGAADDLLACALRVEVRGIPGVYALVEGVF